MSGMEEQINGILNDPEAMEKITRLAQSFMGGGEEEKKEEAPPGFGGIDPAMLGRIGSLMGKLNGGGKDDKTAFLKAISPFLAEKRREKLNRAMQLAQMARLAGVAFSDWGGKTDGD